MSTFRTRLRRGITGTATTALALLAFANPASAATELTTVHVVQLCTQGGQFCNGIERQSFTTTEQYPNMFVEFVADPGHCSDIIVRLSVDGPTIKEVQVGPGESTGAIFVPAAAGNHLVKLTAFGVEGGCNVGKLGSWEGNMSMQRVN